MQRNRPLDLSAFDGKLLDGMIFCRWVYGFLRLLQAESGGIRRIRLQSTKTEKRLIEELIPLARYVQLRYRQGLRIKVRWFAGSQPFDARLFCSGSVVSNGFWPKEMYVEITSSIRANDHLARRYAEETGGVFAAKGTFRNEDTGQIESHPYVYDGFEHIQDLIDGIVTQIAAKNEKSYPAGTVLIVRCVPDGTVLENEWESAIKRIKEAKMEIKFREVFLYEPIMNLSATLYGPHA